MAACRGVPRADDRKVLSGIIFCLQRGYRWSDIPLEYGPAKTFYNRFKRWSEMGVFSNIFKELSSMDTPDLPAACFLFSGKGYDANWFRDGLIGKGIGPCIPPKKNRKYRVSFAKSQGS